MGLLYATHTWCRPEGAVATAVPGGRVWDAPGCRASWWAHRVELVGSGATGAEGFAAWDAAHGHLGLELAGVTLETAAEAPWPTAPQRWAPTRWVGLVHEGPAAPAPAVGTTDPEGAADWISAHHRAEGPEGAATRRWWLGGLAARGAVCLALGDGPDAVATLLVGPDGTGRLQEVFTRPQRRGRGLARALVAAARARCDRLVVAAEHGVTDAWYTAQGFVPRSRATVLIRRCQGQ